MKERPILFSGSMVRAILDCRKTMTRRIVKPQPFFDDRGLLWWHWSKNAGSANIEPVGSPSEEWLARCPYGVAGDRLWVRETAKCGYRSEQPPQNKGCIGVDYQAAGSLMRNYALDRRDDYPWFPSRSHNVDGAIRWAPAIHMPRWASRIALEVTGVWVERLQDISYEDALAEGVSDFAATLTDEERNAVGETPEQTARRLEWPQRQYRLLWDSINAARGYGWDVNPWVWVVEFERIEA